MAIGRTLNIGLNQTQPDAYQPAPKTLRGCLNDAKAMHELALSQGFQGELLLEEAATRDAVIRAINQAAATLQAEDFFLVTFSGHGGFIPDVNGDEDDGQDETWCLYDAELLDDELAVFWSRFKPGVRIWVISDSCHSGTITKPGDLNNTASYHPEPARALSRETAITTWRAHQAFYDGLQVQPRGELSIQASVRLFSGCQDNQQSYDGPKHGTFTTQFLQVWNGGRFQGNYQQFYQQILMRMPAYQSPNHWQIGKANTAFDQQRPFQL